MFELTNIYEKQSGEDSKKSREILSNSESFALRLESNAQDNLEAIKTGLLEKLPLDAIQRIHTTDHATGERLDIPWEEFKDLDDETIEVPDYQGIQAYIEDADMYEEHVNAWLHNLKRAEANLDLFPEDENNVRDAREVVMLMRHRLSRFSDTEPNYVKKVFSDLRERMKLVPVPGNSLANEAFAKSRELSLQQSNELKNYQEYVHNMHPYLVQNLINEISGRVSVDNFSEVTRNLSREAVVYDGYTHVVGSTDGFNTLIENGGLSNLAYQLDINGAATRNSGNQVLRRESNGELSYIPYNTNARTQTNINELSSISFWGDSMAGGYGHKDTPRIVVPLKYIAQNKLILSENGNQGIQIFPQDYSLTNEVPMMIPLSECVIGFPQEYPDYEDTIDKLKAKLVVQGVPETKIDEWLRSHVYKIDSEEDINITKRGIAQSTELIAALQGTSETQKYDISHARVVEAYTEKASEPRLANGVSLIPAY